MRVALKRSILSCVLGGLLPFGVARAQAPFPDLDVIRAWMQDHHPSLVSGDSGLNAAVIVIDTNAKYVRSVAFGLNGNELTAMDGLFANLQYDSVSKRLLSECFDDPSQKPAAARPVCVVDGARVPTIDGLRFVARRGLQVLRGEEASKRFGADAVNGVVTITTDTAMFERFRHVGVTSANFVSFQTNKTRRRADAEQVVITTLMVKGR